MLNWTFVLLIPLLRKAPERCGQPEFTFSQMHHLTYLLFFLVSDLVGQISFAQSIRVMTTDDSSPLPYATVTNHTHPYVVSSDIDGIAHVAATIGDTLSVSYVGYKTAVLRSNGDKLQIVSMLKVEKILLT